MTEERLNRIEQKLTEIEQRVKTLELDMEPEGRISSGFEYLSNDLDSFREETRKRLERLEHGQNQIKASLATTLERLTGWSADQ